MCGAGRAAQWPAAWRWRLHDTVSLCLCLVSRRAWPVQQPISTRFTLEHSPEDDMPRMRIDLEDALQRAPSEPKMRGSGPQRICRRRQPPRQAMPRSHESRLRPAVVSSKTASASRSPVRPYLNLPPYVKKSYKIKASMQFLKVAALTIGISRGSFRARTGATVPARQRGFRAIGGHSGRRQDSQATDA